MRLILPHRDVSLMADIDFEKRNELILNLLKESTGLKDSENDILTVEEYFRFTWDKQNTRTALDIISYYLTKGNTDEEGEDREVLSHKKEKELQKGSKRHVTFSGMSIRQQEDLGIIDVADSNYN